ncbi:hypothetical protein ACTJJ0_20535 [Chitinophaga sp. 22321]|uniref:Uncharacterized protein n=1 Tax=Chitinophaga hostae TaxID=2831022 RepID=A0ABS5J3R4_9BACT|nr:hypothetical protein [Chitinophaga hostae]MBS0029872.1 hypothetical protein [Chitinophaga hostae]
MEQEELIAYEALCNLHATTIKTNPGGSVYCPDIARLTAKLLIEDRNYLYRFLRLHGEKKDILNLALLAEITRAEGYFYYHDHYDNAASCGDIVALFLTEAIELLNNGDVLNNLLIMWYISTVYDIIFHQVWLEEYPPLCASLYFQLSNRMLDPEWIPLYNITRHYYHSLYFIDMAHHWFGKRPEEFMILSNKLISGIKDGLRNKHDYASWFDTYAELTGLPNSDI